MITNITLENFKCFRQVSINPKLLTVLIGPNGTGKSSVLQALLLLKQSVGKDEIRYQGEFINITDLAEIAPNYLENPTSTCTEFTGTISPNESNKDHGFDERVCFRYNADFLLHHSEPFNSGQLGSTYRGESLAARIPEDLNRPVTADGYQATLIQTSRIGVLAEVDSVADGFSYWVSTLMTAPSLLLGQVRVVPSARALVRPTYPLSTEYVEELSLGSGLSLLEEQTASNLAYSRPSEQILSSLLERITGTGLRADTVPPQSVAVKSMVASGAVNMVAEGFGANALILLFHQLIGAHRGATVLIEEPEIHLHPKAQADLAEVLAETAKAEDKQIIMTTHSEHLVERLLLLVAEGTLSADDLAIYSFSKDEKGECFAAEIQVTENGQVEGGLTDFYANNLDTLDRRVKALKRSQ